MQHFSSWHQINKSSIQLLPEKKKESTHWLIFYEEYMLILVNENLTSSHFKLKDVKVSFLTDQEEINMPT